jgi:ubiquinone/menaquinone biosynthesis C-methylase UbiE
MIETESSVVTARDAASWHFDGLSLAFDAGTMRHLSERGLGPGWRCLEVGAGGGSIARWLAERVGPEGHVLATDIDTRCLDGLQDANLEVRCHDIGTDPLTPEASFDLIHARLVLAHVAQRDTAVARMAAALKPGGWLVVEEFGLPAWDPSLHFEPVAPPPLAYQLLQHATKEGGVVRYGPFLPQRMQALGLCEMGAEGRVFRWTGGSPGTWVIRKAMQQHRAQILASGRISEQQYNTDLARLDNPDVAFTSPLMWAVWGRRPALS